VVNNGTHGILVTGKMDLNPVTKSETRYFPFGLIETMEVQDHDGGLIMVRDPRFLQIALDVSEVYEMEEPLR